MNTKTTKFIPMNMLLIVMALILSGCLNPIEIPKASPYTPTPTEIVSSPGVTAVVPVMTTALPPYPTSSENFIKTPSISGAEAEKRIIEFGAGADLSALKDWYKANGIASSNMLPVVYEEAGDVHWDLAAKGTNGNFLKFTITSGKEANQLVRAMGMVSYLYNRPEFKVSELIKPAELNGTTQQMIWDKSGWSVIGAFKGGSLVGWFNADKNMWIMEQPKEVEVTPTPEYETIHSSLEIEGNVDGVPVKVTFAIGQDVYDREELPLDKWIINPEAQEYLSPNTVENVLAKEIMKAHYFAWQGDDFVNRKPVTFEEYIQKLKDGEDMSYEIAAAVPGSVLESRIEKVDPLNPVTAVLINKMGGYSAGVGARDASMFYYVTNGSLRIELFMSLESLKASMPVDDFERNYPRLSWDYLTLFESSLQGLSMDIEYQVVDQNKAKLNAYTESFFKERPEVNQLITDMWLNPTGGKKIADYVNMLLIKGK